jgi:hypothetical protein
MRILLTMIVLFAFSVNITAQKDFRTLDKLTYDYYLKGDYKNLKKTSDTMLSLGMDYYYLRIRLGLLAYNKQLYPVASVNFSKALEFNSTDTISNEFIYDCFIYSGRSEDANLYLQSVPPDKRNSTLGSVGKPGLSEIFVSSLATRYDVTLYETNSLYYEAVRSNFSVNAGFESYLSNRFKVTFALTDFRKTGTEYSATNPSGKSISFTQNQVYARLAGYVFNGWQFSGFGHLVFFSDVVSRVQSGNSGTTNIKVTEYLTGLGVTKNGWKLRTGADFSLSNFYNSDQIRGEAYLTWLPSGNLNLYFTSGWMGQTDRNWGGTYQINQEIGFKINKLFWIESGIAKGNSFLYARNQGFVLNNSMMIPATTIYANIILLPGKHFRITLIPLYSENQFYSWNLNAYTRTNKLINNSFGGSIKITYKIR